MSRSQPTPSEQLFSNLDRQRVPLWVKLAVCIGIGVILAIITPLIVRERYFASLSERVQTIARLVSPARVTSLKNDSADSDDDYSVLKKRLEKVKQVNADARFIYIMARDDKRDVSFLVDSEEPGSDGFSPRGQAYPEASAQLTAMFDGSAPLIEGPVTDRWGSWLSALAPIQDETTGKTVGVVGLDVPSTTYLTTLITAALVPLVGSALIATIVFIADRSRRKRLDTLRMRGELVSIASHELRSPLTGIRWGEEMLLQAKLGERESKIVSSMYESTLQLQESIEDMLQLASVQHTATTTTDQSNRVTTNLVEFINAIFVTQQLVAQQKNMTLEYGPNWPVLVMASVDPLPMKRTFNNLISNAIKYSRPNTKIVIDYERVDGAHVFTIQDHGIGIPKGEQHKVFEGFYRASNAVKEGVNGTGMGLYLSRSVITQHGGKLWLESSEGKGTTIYVRLPAK